MLLGYRTGLFVSNRAETQTLPLNKRYQDSNKCPSKQEKTIFSRKDRDHSLAGAQTENLEQMLRVTRQSLDRLRLLARRSDDRPKHKETALPKPSTSKEQATTTDARPSRADHDLATTSRLVEAVDSLVTLVDAPT